MSIYFGNKGLHKRLDEMLAENTFFLDAWAYAKPIDAEAQYLLDCIAPVVFLKEVQTNVNKRKIALKIYKREKSLIEESLDESTFERYMWIRNKEESIYPYEEQENIAKLVAFLADKGRLNVEKATQMIVQLFPFIKTRLEAEKNTLHYRNKARQEDMFNASNEGEVEFDFSKKGISREITQANFAKMSRELPLDKKIMFKNLESRGILFPLELDETKIITYNRYLKFFITIFYNSCIKDFVVTHTLLKRREDLIAYLEWGLNRNRDFLKKYHFKEFEIIKEKLEQGFFIDKKERTISLGTINLKFNKRSSVLGIIDEYREQILSQKNKLVDQYEKENDKALNKSLKSSPQSLNVMNPKYSLHEIADFFAESFKKDEEQRKAKYDKLMELYRLQLIACDSLQVHTVSSLESKKGLFYELLRLEFNQQILDDINRLFETYKVLLHDHSEREYDWHELPLDELGDLIHTYKIDSSIFYEDLFMFVHAALIVLQNHFSSQGVHSSELEELEQLKNSEIEKHKEEISNLKIQLTHKEQEKNRLTKENEELKEKASLSSKKDSRIESLENKLEKAQNDIERLQAELENQEPIVIEKQVSNQQLSEAETLKFLNSDEENIFFVGGHQLMIAKMRQWAQKVEFIEPRDYTKEISSKATTVIICVAYLNHSMYHKTLSRINQIKEHHDVKVVYINTQSTNKEYLLKEIGSQL